VALHLLQRLPGGVTHRRLIVPLGHRVEVGLGLLSADGTQRVDELAQEPGVLAPADLDELGHRLAGLKLDQAPDGAADLEWVVSPEPLHQRRDGSAIPSRDERGDRRVTHERILRAQVLHQPGIVALPRVELHPRFLDQPVHDLVQGAPGGLLSALEGIPLHGLASGGLQRDSLHPVVAAAADAERGRDLLGSR
jgi:hypothetical protein